MQALNQALRWAHAQHRHQADAVVGLPDKLYRLTLELLPEAVAMEWITTHARANQRYQRQPLAQTQLARQPGFVEQLQGAVDNL